MLCDLLSRKYVGRCVNFCIANTLGMILASSMHVAGSMRRTPFSGAQMQSKELPEIKIPASKSKNRQRRMTDGSKCSLGRKLLRQSMNAN